MSALPLLIEFSDKGIKVRVDGLDLVLTPRKALTSNLALRVKKEKSALLTSLDKIRQKAGDDWEEVNNDPEQLKAFADLLAIEDMRLSGIVPDHYTSETECKRCGTVPIFAGCPPKIIGCPWCFNRLKGLPIPRAPHCEEFDDD